MPHSAFQSRHEFNPQRLESHDHLPTFDGSLDPYYFREWVRQLEDYFESCHIPEPLHGSIAKSHLKGRALQFWIKLEDHKKSRGEYLTWKDMRRELNLKYRPSTSDRHLEHHPTSFVGTTHGHYCGRDHPPISNTRVAAQPCRFSPSLDGRPSMGYSVGSIPYNSPLRPNSSHSSQPLASPILDPAYVILIKNCSKEKKSNEPETEYIHFVDTINNKDFFEDETEVIESDSWHDLNPELGKLEPLNDDTLAHPDPSLIEDTSLDKVCLDDSNMILKETDLTVNTLKLKSEDSDLITEMTPNNSDLILNNSMAMWIISNWK
ncbi:uncharacterized protein LOC114579567 [Dendrobium catenatum]|uniref:uncharacterized protein LOC114579567 n=1 Tax=Dendrobium catenatum TaxID=906689 RepID=UPI0010A017E9|nr:uncharacterized protein LOC114579567 [Dendrobium catenatum]